MPWGRKFRIGTHYFSGSEWPGVPGEAFALQRNADAYKLTTVMRRPLAAAHWRWMDLFGFALPIARATRLSEIAIVGARSLDVVLARATHQFKFALRYQLECAGAFGSDLGGAFDVIIGNVAIHIVV